MNKVYKTITIYMLMCIVILSSVPITVSAESGEIVQQQSQEIFQTKAEQIKSQLTEQYHISEQTIQDALDKGYTLNDVSKALKLQSTSNIELKEALRQISPSFIRAEFVEQRDIENNTTSSKSKISTKRSARAADSTSKPIPIETLTNVKIKTDEAPYSIGLINESVSTISGSLSTSVDDISIPGRNGLSFTLTRTYDSSAAQYYELGNYYTSELSYEEKLFPIGKGWSWNIPSIEMKYGKKYLHLAGGGTYEINGNELLGYPWKDITFSEDTTVNVDGELSAYVVTNIQNIKQYFNSNGRIILISDAYGNKIKFSYINDPTYGKLLTTITDSVGNNISITYKPSEVIISSGNKIVKYQKGGIAGRETLNQVTDPQNRVTQYSYSYIPAKYDLTSTSPYIDNPYALLSKVIHPTGAETIYTYESNPVNRIIYNNAVNQVYRIKQREDKIYLDNGTSETKNMKRLSYEGDLGSSYGSVEKFSTVVEDDLIRTIFTNKKTFRGDNNPLVFYKLQEKSWKDNIIRTTSYTYDESKFRTEPLSITNTIKDIENNTESKPIVLKQTYDDYKNILTSTDPINVNTTYSYDETTHMLRSVSQPISSSQIQYTEYERNAAGDITQQVIKDGNSTGKILQKINYSYDGFGNTIDTKVTNDNKVITANVEYSPAYQNAYPTKQTINATDVDGKQKALVTQAEYNINTGDMLKYIDGNNNSTNYQYDLLGRVTHVTQADNSFVTYSYNDALNQVEITDETGVRTLTKWNPLGWVIEKGIFDSVGYKAKEKSGYDNYGRVIWSEDAIGNRNEMNYDAWNRQIETVFADGSHGTSQYDDVNNSKRAIDQEGNTRQTTFDILGRVIREEEIKNSKKILLGSYEYDYIGNVLSSTDANGNVTTNEYDTLSRLTSVVNAKHEEYKYKYDMVGNLTQVEQPDQSITTKQYDELGRVIKKIDPNGNQNSFYYDGNGNLKKKIDKNEKTVTFDYSDRNLLVKKTSSNEQVSFSYDEAGRRKSMSDSTGTTVYSYKQFTKELEKVIFPDGKSIAYQYNTQGLREQMTDPFGGVLFYSYDDMNRLRSVGQSKDTPEAQYHYYSNGLIKQIQTRNGISSDYTYDGIKLDTLVHKNSSNEVFNSFNYSYDLNGNQTSKNENNKSYNFTYDVLNRLKTSSQFDEVYEYDQRGNRLSLQDNKQTSAVSNSYEYDESDRLTKVTTDNGKIVTYRYNGDNLLYEREENGEIIRYYYDGTDIIAEGSVKGDNVTLKQRYIRGNGLVATDVDNVKAYYLKNGHGDIVELRDSNGLPLNQYEYDIWGNPIKTEETIRNVFRYSGELWDESTSLQYLRARWYDPNDGRFINEDKYEGELTNPLSQNLYTYVHNNPLRYIDPTGHAIDKANAELLLEIAGAEGANSDAWWVIREILGTEALKNPVNILDKNNDFKFKYNLATGNHYIKSWNTSENAEWAKGELVKEFDRIAKMEESMQSLGMGLIGRPTIGKAWIKRSVYKEIGEVLGKDAQKKFSNAMKKGIVGPEGINGIKPLEGKGIMAGKTYYKYEIKVKGKYGAFRALGNLDKSTEHIIFEYFEKTHK